MFEGPNTHNNEGSTASVITNIPPDLVVSSITVTPAIFSGETIDVSWTVTNIGPAAVYAGTQQWSDWVLFSAQPTFSPDTVSPLGSLVHVQTTPLQPGQSYTAHATFTIPAGIATGTYYIYVATDANVNPYHFSISLDGTGTGSFPGWPDFFAMRVWEGATKANNINSASTVVTYREADLQIESATGPAATDSGSTFTVNFTATNVGTRDTRTDTWYDSVYLSTDTSIDSSDKLIGSVVHKGILAAGASYSGTITALLPDDIGGDYHLIVITNAGYGAAPGDDPSRFPGAISTANVPALNEYAGTAPNQTIIGLHVNPVPLPDLVVSTVTSDAHVLVGQQFSVTWTVTNVGAGPVPPLQSLWTDIVYLSLDQFLDVRSDLYLGQVDHSGVLQPNGSYTVTRTFNLPHGITGPYYVFVLTDPVGGSFGTRGKVVEANESNNSRATVTPMLIDLPPPSDLQVDSVSIAPDASVGNTLTVTYTVSNHGTQPASGYWSDSVYLSTDNTWDYGDILLGTVGPPLGGRTLQPGESYTATLTAVVPPALPGSYRIIVRADVFNDIYEGANEINNDRASADAVNVSVPTLTVGAPVTVAIPDGGELLYRVQVPDGQTLQVSLDASGGANELYLGHEFLPDSIKNDAAYAGALQPSQVAVVPTTTAGYYYILVRGGSGAQVTLDANFLPFGITGVTPDTVGAGQYVTMTVTGAQFSPQATVKLIRPDFGEDVPVNYAVVNATKIVAVFDLTGSPDGLYDLQVTNPDGTSQVIPYRVLLQDPLPLDADIGLGGPDQIVLSKAGFPSAYYGVSLQSLTNIDAPYLFIQYGVPRLTNNTIIPGERLLFQTDLQGAPNVAGVPWADLNPVLNLNGELTASGFAFDFTAKGFGSLSFGVQVYPGLKALLAADPTFLSGLDESTLASLAFNFNIFAAVTPMTSAEYVTFQTQRADDLRDKILTDSAAPQQLNSFRPHPARPASRASTCNRSSRPGSSGRKMFRPPRAPPRCWTATLPS